MLIAAVHHHVLPSGTASNVYGGLIVAAILTLATYFWRRSKKFFDNIEQDHKTVQAQDLILKSHDVLFTTLAQDVKTTKDIAVQALAANTKSARALSRIMVEIKPNGGHKKTAGDTVARTEQKLDELTLALQTAGIVPKLDTDTEYREQTPEKEENDDKHA
jgi:hypothetical protein